MSVEEPHPVRRLFPRWLANMILMNRKDHFDDIVPIFMPRI